jgi:fluoroquinolone transport system permease protein
MTAARFLPALRVDLLVQWRYGFVFAGLFVSAFWIVLLRSLPGEWLPWTLPLAIFVDVSVVGFYFLAGQVLFEKAEATLDAVVVSPLTFWEYIGSKLVSLLLLTLGLTAVIVVGVTFSVEALPALLLGAGLMAPMALLLAFIAVAPHQGMASFLVPSQVWLLPFQLPLLDAIGVWTSPLLYVLPTQGILLLLRAPWAGIEAWQVAYAVGWNLVFCTGLMWLARRRFEVHIRHGGAA